MKDNSETIKSRKEKAKGRFYISLFCLYLFFCLPYGVYAQDGREKAEALLKESVALSDEGSTDKAIEAIRESIKADQGYADAHDQLGYMLLKKGQNDEAINAFDAALKLNPRMRTSKTGKGLALLKKGDLKAAETILKEALQLNPYPSTTHYALGLVYEKLNEYDKALEHYKEGIKKYKSGKK